MIQKWLKGWKQIGDYLGVSAQTAKTYCKKHGMPIRRGPGGRPIALISEVDKWLMGFKKRK